MMLLDPSLALVLGPELDLLLEALLLNGVDALIGYLASGPLAIPVWLARAPAMFPSALAILMSLLGPSIPAL